MDGRRSSHIVSISRNATDGATAWYRRCKREAPSVRYRAQMFDAPPTASNIPLDMPGTEYGDD